MSEEKIPDWVTTVAPAAAEVNRRLEELRKKVEDAEADKGTGNGSGTVGIPAALHDVMSAARKIGWQSGHTAPMNGLHFLALTMEAPGPVRAIYMGQWPSGDFFAVGPPMRPGERITPVMWRALKPSE